jgi:ferritin-like metal-binding protein YciE
MKNKLILYAREVGYVGTDMKKTANKFGQLSDIFRIKTNKTIEDIVELKKGYEELLEEFKDQERRINNVDVPSLLENEHSELKRAFNRYVKATDQAIRSLDTDSGKVDQELYQQAEREQQQASKEIVIVSNRIVDKINSAI